MALAGLCFAHIELLNFFNFFIKKTNKIYLERHGHFVGGGTLINSKWVRY